MGGFRSEFTHKQEAGTESFPGVHPEFHFYFSTVSVAMATTQGPEKTAIEVAPGGALPSERSVVKSKLWKENAEKILNCEP